MYVAGTVPAQVTVRVDVRLRGLKRSSPGSGVDRAKSALSKRAIRSGRELGRSRARQRGPLPFHLGRDAVLIEPCSPARTCQM